MKARRNFVVEFKSGRRRPGGPRASIWGDTDLQAIARAVEADLPNMGGGAEAERGSVRPSLRPDRSVPRILETIEKPDDQPSVADLAETMASDLVTPPASAAEPRANTDDAADAPVPVSVREETAPAAPLRRRAASKVTQPARKKAPARSASTETLQQNDSDDLDELEAENRRLKALWRAHLHAENIELRDMLVRLSAI